MPDRTIPDSSDDRKGAAFVFEHRHETTSVRAVAPRLNHTCVTPSSIKSPC